MRRGSLILPRAAGEGDREAVEGARAVRRRCKAAPSTGFAGPPPPFHGGGWGWATAATVLFSSATLAQAAPKGDPAAGASLFEDRCVMCHVVAGGGQGPSLTGVVGRKAGSAAGFHYTAALKASGVTWSAADLDRFLAGPGKAVPGTAMAVAIHDPGQRADLIAYLASKRAHP